MLSAALLAPVFDARADRVLFSVSGLDAGGDRAAFAMAEVGDQNGDGIADLLVGSPRASVEGRERAGKVSLLSGRDGRELLVFNSGVAGAELGSVVGTFSDRRGNARPVLFMGAPGGTESSERWAWLFSTLPTINSLIASRSFGREFIGFGSSFANVGDIDGDGVDDIAVGVPEFDEPNAAGGMSGEGKVYIISGQSLTLMGALGVAQSDVHSGVSLASLGDINGDGVRDLAVGATDNGGTVRVYDINNGNVLWELRNPNPSISGFAKDLEAVGDINRDGAADILVSSINQNAQIVSGRDGALIRTLSSSIAFRIADQSGDGVDEIAEAFLPGSEITRSSLVTVRITDGATGMSQRSVSLDSTETATAIAGRGIGDLDADGKGDYLIDMNLFVGGASERRILTVGTSEVPPPPTPTATPTETPVPTSSGNPVTGKCSLSVTARCMRAVRPGTKCTFTAKAWNRKTGRRIKERLQVSSSPPKAMSMRELRGKVYSTTAKGQSQFSLTVSRTTSYEVNGINSQCRSNTVTIKTTATKRR